MPSYGGEELIANNDTPAQPPSNSARLMKHLDENALSTRLVQAHAELGGDISTLKRVVAERLEQVRQALDSKD